MFVEYKKRLIKYMRKHLAVFQTYSKDRYVKHTFCLDIMQINMIMTLNITFNKWILYFRRQVILFLLHCLTLGKQKVFIE